MDFNLPPKVRSALYAIVTVSTPVVAYLGAQGKLSDFAVGLFAVIISAISALAFRNVSQ